MVVVFLAWRVMASRAGAIVVVAVVVATLTFLIRDHLVRTLFVDPVMRCGSRRFETQVHVDNLNPPLFFIRQVFFFYNNSFFNKQGVFLHKAFLQKQLSGVFSFFTNDTVWNGIFFLFFYISRDTI